MKIYREVIINMHTGDTIYEDSYEYNGHVAMCSGGGGGGSGEVRYPGYVETQHGIWLADIAGLITGAITGASPYFTLTAFDPDPTIAIDNSQLNVLLSYVNGLDPTQDWEDAVDNTIAKMRDALPDDTAIATAVNNRESRLAPSHMRAIARIASSYGDLNALNSSAFFVALALQEVDFQREINEFQNQLEVTQENLRLQLIAQGLQLILGNAHDKVRLAHAASESFFNVNRGHVIMQKEETDRNIEISVRDARWDLETYSYGANMLAGPGGGTSMSDKPSQAQTSLSMTATGAAAGSAILPGWGTGIGAGLGLIASFF